MSVSARACPNGSAPRPVRRAADMPPHDLGAERAVLSAIMIDPTRLAEVRGILAVDDLYLPAHRNIYSAACAAGDAGTAVDPVTIAAELARTGQLARVGGAPALGDIIDASPAVANVGAHARIVADHARARRELEAAQRLAAGLRAGDADLVARARAELAGAGDRDAAVRPATIRELIVEWSGHGPLAHEPTGIERLDELTGGGPVYGTRWYIAGAPDAGKTALLVQIAHVYAERGIAVGLLAVDEDPSDLVTRLAQRVGYARSACDARDPAVLAEMREALGGLPIRIYDDRWTVESAAADLAAYAAERGSRAMLGVDSVQTVRCAAERAADREPSTAEAVTLRVRAIRCVATLHRLIAVATSELGRASYASSDPGQRTATLAAAKWSGAIEYSARVLIGLRSVPGEADLTEIEIAKNKHGPRTTGEADHGHVYLRLDRRAQTMCSVTYEPPPEGDRHAERVTQRRDATAHHAGIAAIVVARQPGLVTSRLEPAIRAAAGVGTQGARDALAALGEALVVRTGERRAQAHYIDGGRVPGHVLAALTEPDRAVVSSSRPPAEERSDA